MEPNISGSEPLNWFPAIALLKEDDIGQYAENLKKAAVKPFTQYKRTGYPIWSSSKCSLETVQRADYVEYDC